MHIREIRTLDQTQIVLELPQEWKGKRVEIIVLPLEEKSEGSQEWPEGFFTEVLSSLPDFPDRAPQGELEEHARAAVRANTPLKLCSSMFLKTA